MITITQFSELSIGFPGKSSVNERAQGRAMAIFERKKIFSAQKPRLGFPQRNGPRGQIRILNISSITLLSSRGRELRSLLSHFGFHHAQKVGMNGLIVG